MAEAKLAKKNLLGSLVPPGTSPVTPSAWVWSQHFLGWFFLFCFAGIEEQVLKGGAIVERNSAFSPGILAALKGRGLIPLPFVPGF